MHVCMYVCMYVCMCVYVCECVYVCMYAYVCVSVCSISLRNEAHESTKAYSHSHRPTKYLVFDPYWIN